MTRDTNEAKVVGSKIKALTITVVSVDFALKIAEILSHTLIVLAYNRSTGALHKKTQN